MQLETELEALRRLGRIVRESLDGGNCETLKFTIWQARAAAFQAAALVPRDDEPELRMRRRLTVILHESFQDGELECADPPILEAILSILGRSYPGSKIHAVREHREVWLLHGNQPYEDLDAWWEHELAKSRAEDEARVAARATMRPLPATTSLAAGQDYFVAEHDVWLRIKGFYVRLVKTDDGICCDIFDGVDEEGDCLASVDAFDNDLKVNNATD